MGPALVALVLGISNSVTISLLPVLALFVLGFVILYFVDTNENYLVLNLIIFFFIASLAL